MNIENTTIEDALDNLQDTMLVLQKFGFSKEDFAKMCKIIWLVIDLQNDS